MSISAAFDGGFGLVVFVAVAAKAKSCLSRSAKSFDRLPWNSGFAVLHGWLPTLKYLFF
jgi:hypothetical protein